MLLIQLFSLYSLLCHISETMKLLRSVDEHILEAQLWQLSCSVLNVVVAPSGTCGQS